MRALVAGLLLWGGAAMAAEVAVPGDGVQLRASYTRPAQPASAPAIVALHGCSGPWRTRDQQWQRLLAEAGHAVLMPDSFGSRGLGSQCKVADRTVRAGRERRADTVAAVAWLQAQAETPPGGVYVLGWSDGGSTVLAAAAEGVFPPGAVRGFVAFYPGCRGFAADARWAPSAKVLILIGAADDWTPAEPCRRLAARFPGRITLVEYPGAYHDFDVPARPVTARDGLAFSAGGAGVAHTGTDAAGREDAIGRVLAFTAH